MPCCRVLSQHGPCLRGHPTSPPFRWPRSAKLPSLTEMRLHARRYVHLPDRLLHLLHHQPTGWRGIQPSYCFHGATITHWQRPTLLQLVLGWRPAFRPSFHPYAYTPAFGSHPHTRALLLPSLHRLLATGCREAISDFTVPALSSIGSRSIRQLSRKG